MQQRPAVTKLIISAHEYCFVIREQRENELWNIRSQRNFNVYNINAPRWHAGVKLKIRKDKNFTFLFFSFSSREIGERSPLVLKCVAASAEDEEEPECRAR